MILGIPSRPGLRVMVASKPIDFRKGIDGLVAMVVKSLPAKAAHGHVYLGAQAAARAAKGLIFRPLFLAPAAC